jgi:hypothetical protein
MAGYTSLHPNNLYIFSRDSNPEPSPLWGKPLILFGY